MAKQRLRLDEARSKVLIHGRATGHRFHTTFSGLKGSLEFSESYGEFLSGTFSLPMEKADAGDFLRTTQIKRFLDPRSYPETTFHIEKLSTHSSRSFEELLEREEEVEAEVHGSLSYRGQTVALTTQARGSLSETRGLRARCTFKFDIRKLGIEPPGFLFLKVNPEVEIEVELFGS